MKIKENQINPISGRNRKLYLPENVILLVFFLPYFVLWKIESMLYGCFLPNLEKQFYQNPPNLPENSEV